MVGAVVGGSTAIGAVIVVWWFFSPKYTDVGYQPKQPVEFSHKLHAGDMGLDCRYCHSNVEKSQEANVPSAQICMNCHTQVKQDSPKLKLVRESYAEDKPIEWIRIHKLGEYAYFDHSAHSNAGVGCSSCHGRIDKMEVVSQAEPLSMGWCLDCHRNPGEHLRPHSELTNMSWKQTLSDKEIDALIKDRNLNPPENCSACHR